MSESWPTDRVENLLLKYKVRRHADIDVDHFYGHDIAGCYILWFLGQLFDLIYTYKCSLE